MSSGKATPRAKKEPETAKDLPWFDAQKDIILLILMSYMLLNFFASLILSIAPLVIWQALIITSERLFVAIVAYYVLNFFILLQVAVYYHPEEKEKLFSPMMGGKTYIHITVALGPCPDWMLYFAYGIVAYGILCGLLFHGYLDHLDQTLWGAVCMHLSWFIFAMLYAGYLYATGKSHRS
jgi:hypothetical protein